MADPPDRRFVVGYALSPKKQRSFIQPSLVSTARDRGVDLVPIDPSRPLVEQGPFDCVIHKLHGDGWKTQIADFAAKNPGVPIVDQPLAIERLNKRLTALTELELASEYYDPHGIPNEMRIYDSSSQAFKVIIDHRFPSIAKPLMAASDGRSKSQELSLLFKLATAVDLEPPLALQEFIKHGGVIFKVYVAGNCVHCVRNFFDPEGVEHDENLEAAELPSSSFFEKIARGLRITTELRLFNFDMIRDVHDRKYYHLIDINYFPGYAKMPGYEEFVTDFFWDMVHQKEE